eukprot:8902528-Pyramimonas_sp.AAC.1
MEVQDGKRERVGLDSDSVETPRKNHTMLMLRKQSEKRASEHDRIPASVTVGTERAEGLIARELGPQRFAIPFMAVRFL